MNGYQRVNAALQSEPSDQVPIMLHNFMLSARESGYTMEQFRNDPEVIAESFIRSVETYQYDGILVDIDTATLAGALGVPIEFMEDDPATSFLGCLDPLKDVAKLPSPDIGAYKHIQIWLEAVAKLKSHFGDEIFIRGNCDQAPFSLASMMRSPQEWFMDLIRAPELALDLLEYCTDAVCQFVALMSQTGAHMISNGDSPAGPELISPEMYRKFALPFEKRVVEAAHKYQLPYALHICGNTGAILDDMLNTGADAFELDYKTDIQLAQETYAGKATLIGNIDPVGVLQQGSPELIATTTRKLLEVFVDTPGFILNAGCAIPADTPHENIKTMIDTARNFKRSF